MINKDIIEAFTLLAKEKQSKLLKWFYAAAMWGRYSRGAVETILDDDLSTIKNNNDHIKKMIDSVTKVRGGSLNVTPADLEGKNTKSPFFMLSYVLTRQNHARDWRTGNEVSLQSAGIEFKNLKVDGGASNNDLLMQIQSNLLGNKVIRPKTTETTAIGAAFMAGLATGFWSDISELNNLWEMDKTFNPNEDFDSKSIIDLWDKRIGKTLSD